MFTNRVYQSHRNIETSPDFAIMLFPATPPVFSFLAAFRYAGQVVGGCRPAALNRSLR